MLVRQRAIVSSGGRLVGRQAGNVDQTEANGCLGSRLESRQACITMIILTIHLKVDIDSDLLMSALL